MSTFPDKLYELGGLPVSGNGMLPLMGGSGKVYFVDPANGSDSNSGTKPSKALDTVTAAYNKCVDKSGDTIYLLNDGNTSGSSRQAANLSWAKDNVHLVGLCAPAAVSQRARITPVSGSALVEYPMIDVTGRGNVLANVQIAHFGADTDAIGCRGVDVSGNRNYFYNVHMVGVPNNHSGDETDCCDLLIDGGSENVFKHCTFGIDTIARSTTNASIEFTTQAARNLFEDCLINIYADNAGALFIKADAASDLDRWTIFRNCIFMNGSESGATTMTAGCNVHDAAGGLILFQHCTMVDASDVSAHNGTTWVDGLPGTTTSAIGVETT